jgi:hypothetical protein
MCTSNQSIWTVSDDLETDLNSCRLFWIGLIYLRYMVLPSSLPKVLQCLFKMCKPKIRLTYLSSYLCKYLIKIDMVMAIVFQHHNVKEVRNVSLVSAPLCSLGTLITLRTSAKTFAKYLCMIATVF